MFRSNVPAQMFPLKCSCLNVPAWMFTPECSCLNVRAWMFPLQCSRLNVPPGSIARMLRLEILIRYLRHLFKKYHSMQHNGEHTRRPATFRLPKIKTIGQTSHCWLNVKNTSYAGWRVCLVMLRFFNNLLCFIAHFLHLNFSLLCFTQLFRIHVPAWMFHMKASLECFGFIIVANITS